MVVTVLCILAMFLSSFLVSSSALNDLSKATSCAGRAAAVCATESEAMVMAEIAAETAVSDARLSGLSVEMRYVGGTEGWETGGYLKVTVSADVSTFDPFTSGRREKSVIVCIEQG